ncbi:MAG TPA: hypothetical protein VI732_01785 [Alphaproteobacteria bacterium]|nr:hypothetical protein [Alphaproteobacteria bacterium]
MAGPVIARMRWRDTRILRAIHLMLAAEYREIPPTLDEAKLARALEKPRALIQAGTADAFRLAASYAAAIAHSRALGRGNGALALAALDAVLRLGGKILDAPEAEAAAVLQELESGGIGAAEIEAWARANAAAA